MSTPNAADSGVFTIGGTIKVNRLGFGAMRVTGKGIWGEPEDRDECIRTLRRVPDLGVNLIDTADAYGPDISEELIRETLYPYDGMLIATKGGLTRTGPAGWIPLGRPEYLIQQAQKSRRRLGVETIGLWQLHRIDSKVPRDEQFAAVRQLIDDGVIAKAGLSEVSVEDIKAAEAYFPVATVQNRYNLVDRASEEVLAYCEANTIGFIPWAPLGSGKLARPGSLLDGLAKKLDATPGQIALAWMLKRSPAILPIPGTSRSAHLEANVAAAGIELSDGDFAALDAEGRNEAAG